MISRRNFLKGAGLAGGTLALVGCGGGGGAATTDDATTDEASGELISVGIINNDPNESGYRTANDKDMKETFTEENGFAAEFAYSMKNEEQIASALSRIVTRHPSLEPKRRYIMSVPVFPDEAAFTAFADRAIDYLGVRYHESIEPRRRVTERTYNNVASSIRTMQVRLYNERENLRYYSREASDRFSYLEDLVVWAAEDLAGKEVVMDERKVGRLAGIDGL